MTISFVRHLGSQATKSSVDLEITVSPAEGAAQGNLVVIRFSEDTNGASPCVTAVTDDRSNTYVSLHDFTGADHDVAIFASVLTTALQQNDKIYVNVASPRGPLGAAADEFTGVTATEIATSAASESTGTSHTSGASGTPSAAVGLVLGCAGHRMPGANSYTQDADSTGGASWSTLTAIGTSGQSSGSNIWVGGAYKVTTSAAAQTYDVSDLTNDNGAATVVVLGEAAGGVTVAWLKA